MTTTCTSVPTAAPTSVVAAANSLNRTRSVIAAAVKRPSRRLHGRRLALLARAAAVSLAFALASPALVSAQTPPQPTPPKQDAGVQESKISPKAAEEIDRWAKSVDIATKKIFDLQNRCPPDKKAIAAALNELKDLTDVIDRLIETRTQVEAVESDEYAEWQRARLDDFKAFDRFDARRNQIRDQIRQAFAAKANIVAPWSKQGCPRDPGTATTGTTSEFYTDITGHYDDGHSFGWTSKPPEKRIGEGSADSGQNDKSSQKKTDDTPRKPDDKQPGQGSADRGQGDTSNQKKTDDAPRKPVEERRAGSPKGPTGMHRQRRNDAADRERAAQAGTGAAQISDLANAANLASSLMQLGGMHMGGMGSMGGMHTGGMGGMHMGGMGGMHSGGMGGSARR